MFQINSNLDLNKLSSTIFCCLCVSDESVSLSAAQISTFFNIYRHKSPLLSLAQYTLSSVYLIFARTKTRLAIKRIQQIVG